MDIMLLAASALLAVVKFISETEKSQKDDDETS